MTKEQKAELRAWQKAYRWPPPHQIRHNAATKMRKGFSIETARIILGHHSDTITEVHAGKDEHEAIKAILQVG